MARLIDFTNKITNYLNAVWHYAVEDVGGAPKDGYIVLSELIDYIKENVTLIQSKSFISTSSTTITNNSSTIFVDTDLIVAITPKSATSKLRINSSTLWGWVTPAQQGVRISLSYKIGAGSWITVKIVVIRDYEAEISAREYSDNLLMLIDSPGIIDEVQLKISFATYADGQEVIYRPNLGIITVDEILE